MANGNDTFDFDSNQAFTIGLTLLTALGGLAAPNPGAFQSAIGGLGTIGRLRQAEERERRLQQQGFTSAQRLQEQLDFQKQQAAAEEARQAKILNRRQKAGAKLGLPPDLTGLSIPDQIALKQQFEHILKIPILYATTPAMALPVGMNVQCCMREETSFFRSHSKTLKISTISYGIHLALLTLGACVLVI